MIKGFFRRVAEFGVQPTMSELHRRSIIITNRISIISFLLTFLFLLYSLRNGWSYYDAIILGMCLLQALVAVLNRFNFTTISRILLTVTIPVTSMVLVLIAQLRHPFMYPYDPGPGVYAVLLATSVIPVLIYTNDEKRPMYFGLIVNFAFFCTLDLVIRWFSVLHALPTPTEYIASNLALIMTFVLLIGSVLVLKSIVNEFELRNNKLIAGLNQKNTELEKAYKAMVELNNDIETQNEEIQAQHEELMQSQESLTLANQEIERRKKELEEKNTFLEASLDEKNKDLLQTNQQLVIHNSELEQFSYTVSHNLRGPVASLLGLINIYRLSATQQERDKILNLVEQAAQSLETIIRDLNKIIDIRHDKFTTFEEVTFETEVTLIKQSLESFLKENDVTIETKFECEKIVSTKAYINSILYNLISNAIQYRSPNRKPRIKLFTSNHTERVTIVVSDNGLGMDLTRFGNDVFRLYKRFHTHVQGKGLGLYLVKQQVEKLNGRIQVESTPDEGTTFKISLPVKE